jgi:hypothetical protein
MMVKPRLQIVKQQQRVREDASQMQVAHGNKIGITAHVEAI